MVKERVGISFAHHSITNKRFIHSLSQEHLHWDVGLFAQPFQPLVLLRRQETGNLLISF
jgi:hypothetical protein